MLKALIITAIIIVIYCIVFTFNYYTMQFLPYIVVYAIDFIFLSVASFYIYKYLK